MPRWPLRREPFAFPGVDPAQVTVEPPVPREPVLPYLHRPPRRKDRLTNFGRTPNQ